MLYEPTFVNPDMRNGLGNGTVDITNGLTVSWQVNGQPYLAAFSITIYQNNATSAQVYTTGKLTDNCPFYGTSAEGEPQMFSYTISASALSTAGMTNGADYKLVITQWWSANDYITQNSASAFITRTTPSVSITQPSDGSIYDKDETFTATYTQAQGDALNWARWQIQYSGNIIYDTYEMSGVSLLELYYDGFLPSTPYESKHYQVRITVQTENGIEATSGWVDFIVRYDAGEESGEYLTASKVCGKSCVKVDWSGMIYIYGESISGSYSISGGRLSLSSGSDAVRWSTVTGQSMEFSAPWSIIWKGTLQNAGQTGSPLFQVSMYGSQSAALYYFPTLANRPLAIEISGFGTTEVSIPTYFTQSAEVTVILTPTEVYFRIEEVLPFTLYPSDTLYPGDTVFPSVQGQTHVTTVTKPISYIQNSIMSATLRGPASVDYFGIFKGTPSETIIQQAYENGNYNAQFTDDTYMMAPFTKSGAAGLNAGNISFQGLPLTGITIYRQKVGEGNMLRVADVSFAQGNGGTVIYDYSAKSQQGNYRWYAFPSTDTAFVTSGALTSNQLNPCFWNWSVLECTATSVKNRYTVVKEYAFANNISSGSMSNNNSPSVKANLTRYPTVQKSFSNYHGGTLTGLIGAVDQYGAYADAIETRDAIYALSISDNPLFLKNRKGDLLRIRISGPITMTTEDGTREQAQTMALPWVETGNTDNVSLVSDTVV